MPIALASSDRPRPFPLPGDRTAEAARSVYRAATAAALAQAQYPTGGSAEAILRQTWGSDGRAMAILTRAATAPATTSTAGWAAELAITTATGAFFASLETQSAASALFAAALRLPLEGLGQVKVPYDLGTPTLMDSFVAEGAPIPVRQAAFSTVTIGPRKMAVLTSLTNELANHSTPSAELILRALLTRRAALALDIAVFSSVAGDAIRPPGILNGVVPIAPTTGSATATDAMLADIQKLADAIATAGGGTTSLIFVASPGRAAKMRVLGGGFVEILGTPAVAADALIAIDPSGVASGYTGDPQIEVAVSGLIHLEDSLPLQIASGAQGSATLATPVRSMFQTDSFALKLIVRCGWGARPGYVQTMSGLVW